jgi:hypothetical protein
MQHISMVIARPSEITAVPAGLSARSFPHISAWPGIKIKLVLAKFFLDKYI